MREIPKLILAALVVSLVTGGCMVVDSVSLFGCKGPVCQLLMYDPVISADGSTATIPFVCRTSDWTPHSPKGRFERLMAIAYSRESQSWQVVPFTEQDLAASKGPKDGVPAIADRRETGRSCAADCNKFAYLGQVDWTSKHYDWEVFYSENGQVRQLTHNMMAPFAVRLSADGRTVVAYETSNNLAFIDVASSKVTIVPVRGVAWKACAQPQ